MIAESVAQPDFIARMADTVAAMHTLCSAIEGAPARHGFQPAPVSVAMGDLDKESRFVARFGEDWLGPVRDTHTFGGMTLFAATDYARCYADLFTGDRAPVYGHLVLARAALEACVISSWLNEPAIETDERVRRGLCELIYSNWEVSRLKIAEADAIANWWAHAQMATAIGWSVGKNRGKPIVSGTQRPAIGSGIARLVLRDDGRDLGPVQWSYLSSLVHVTWYGLRQSVVEPPRDNVTLGPSIASIGTQSSSVNAQSLCLLLALRAAGEARLTMMGWLDQEWRDAVKVSATHELDLLRAVSAASGSN